MAMKMKKSYQSPKVVSVLFDGANNMCIELGSEPAHEILSNERRTNANNANQDKDVEWGSLW